MPNIIHGGHRAPRHFYQYAVSQVPLITTMGDTCRPTTCRRRDRSPTRPNPFGPRPAKYHAEKLDTSPRLRILTYTLWINSQTPDNMITPLPNLLNSIAQLSKTRVSPHSDISALVGRIR